jgi:hypothetical protein
MEPRSIIRTIIAGLVGIGIVVVFIILMVRLFTHSGGGPITPTTNLGQYSDTAATATLLIDAPTKIDQEHRQIRITVSATQNQIELIQGYQGTVVQQQTYANNSAAFGAFLQSLKLVNFTKGDNDSSKSDFRGYCPSGDRYVYTFNDGYKDLFSYWSTSCGQGTFAGNRAVVRQLFERQIPDADFSRFSRNVPIS